MLQAAMRDGPGTCFGSAVVPVGQEQAWSVAGLVGGKHSQLDGGPGESHRQAKVAKGAHYTVHALHAHSKPTASSAGRNQHQQPAANTYGTQ